MIVRDDGVFPYLYCNFGDLPEVAQECIKEDVTRLLEEYHSSHQRTQDWLDKADKCNEEWKRKHEDLGCLLNGGVRLK
jgi:hypothetical protein